MQDRLPFPKWDYRPNTPDILWLNLQKLASRSTVWIWRSSRRPDIFSVGDRFYLRSCVCLSCTIKLPGNLYTDNSVNTNIDYLSDDELHEVTPKSLRIRKRPRDTHMRGRDAAGTSAPKKASAPEVSPLSFPVRLITADNMDYVQNEADQTVVLDRVKDPPIADADPIQVVELLSDQLFAAPRPGFRREGLNNPVNSTEKLMVPS